MRQNSICALAIAASIALGCSHPEKVVYVDLDRVASDQIAASPGVANLPNPPATPKPIVKTIEGSPARVLKDPANTPRLNLKETFQAEHSKALLALQRRLRQFYN